MEWTVITVLIAMVGLIATVLKPVLTLNTAITKLISAVEGLQKNLEELTVRNGRSHERIFNVLDVQDGKIMDHEKRISKIEHN